MRKLDFIVFGLARSGTTALTNLVRANRRLFCGAEFFTPVMDHSKLDVPQAFFDDEARLEGLGEVPQNIRVSMEILRDRAEGEVALYGNKWPLYSHFFDRVMAEAGAPKAIMAYRNYRACARSYQRRADDPRDGWHAGRIGFFAGVELIHIVKRLACTPHTDTLIVPQPYLARNWRGALADISDYLLPGLETVVDETVVTMLERTRKTGQARSPKPLTPRDQPVFRLLDEAGVGEIFPTDHCVRLGDIQSKLARAAAALPQDHIGTCRDMAAEFEDPAVVQYFRTWERIASNSGAIGVSN